MPGHSYKGSSASPPPAGPAAPVLSFDGVNTLSWTWPGPDPDHWELNENLSGEGWNVNSEYAGAARDNGGGVDPDSLWSLQGFDADENPVTGLSNIVSIPP